MVEIESYTKTEFHNKAIPLTSAKCHSTATCKSTAAAKRCQFSFPLDFPLFNRSAAKLVKQLMANRTTLAEVLSMFNVHDFFFACSLWLLASVMHCKLVCFVDFYMKYKKREHRWVSANPQVSLMAFYMLLDSEMASWINFKSIPMIQNQFFAFSLSEENLRTCKLTSQATVTALYMPHIAAQFFAV